MKTEPKFNEQELTDMALSYPLETQEPDSDCQKITDENAALEFLVQNESNLHSTTISSHFKVYFLAILLPVLSVITVLCFLAWDFNLMTWLKSLPWDFIAVIILPNIVLLIIYPGLKRWNE